MTGHDHPQPPYEETYRDRRIRIEDHSEHPGHGHGFEVFIDDRALHVMRRADGGFLSVACHYESFTDPKRVARAAVDALGRSQLAPSPHGTRGGAHQHDGRQRAGAHHA